MAIPGFQDFMLPVLQLASEQDTIQKAEYDRIVSERLGLSDSEKRELLSSGKQTTYQNRIGWAITYLVKARLIERPARATIRITDNGRALLASNPERIASSMLMDYPEFREFSTVTQSKVKNPQVVVSAETSPLEQLDDAYTRLRQSLSSELLDLIMAAPPEFFERLVVELLVAMGYGGTLKDAGQAIGKSGDGGIDGVIKEDRLGLEFIYIQAKRWEGTIHRPQLQAFAGALMERNARKGVFITTSDFSSGAKSFAESVSTNIVLVNGEELADLMIEYGVGVIDEQTYRVRRVDPEYFGE